MPRAVPALKVARNALEEWGRWWRYQEAQECSHGGTSMFQIMMDICALGVRVQTSNTRAHHHLSDAIRVPGWVEDMDERLGLLPRTQCNALVMRYVRRGRYDARALLRAELAVGEMMSRDRLEMWAEA